MAGKKINIIVHEEIHEGAPEWMVTFSDLMCLLLCLFVIMASMGQPKKEKAEAVVNSIRNAFGMDQTTMSNTMELNQLPNSIFDRVALYSHVAPGGSVKASASGRDTLTTTVREGMKVALGSQFAFDEGSSELSPAARAKVAELASNIKGYGNWIDIRGHCSRSAQDVAAGVSGAQGKVQLSLERARAIADALRAEGVLPRRLRITGMSDFDPVRGELTPDDARANRRIEVILLEDVVKDAE